MITVRKAKKEVRARDGRRGRFEMQIGKKIVHVSMEEVLQLRIDIDRALVAHALWMVKQ